MIVAFEAIHLNACCSKLDCKYEIDCTIYKVLIQFINCPAEFRHHNPDEYLLHTDKSGIKHELQKNR